MIAAMKRSAGVAAVVLGAMVWLAPPAAACSCALGTPAQHAGWATTVFVGTGVVDDQVSWTPERSGRDTTLGRVTFEVERVYKGEAFARQEVEVNNLSGCGTTLPLHQRMLVFVPEPVEEGDLRGIHLCSGHRVLGDAPVDPALGEGWAPKPVVGERDGLLPPRPSNRNVTPLEGVAIGLGAVAVLGFVGAVVVTTRRATP